MARRKLEPKEYLFVDGYNIINSWKVFKEDRSDNLEEARKKLIDILLEYQVYSGLDITIVFDAHLVKGNNGTKEEINGLKIVYTQEHETADHYIERSIAEMGRLRKVKVATSDNLEQQIILGRGATRISARELEEEIFGSKKVVNNSRKKENEKNDYHFGRLDDDLIDKLKNFFDE